jgi:DNA repair protein RadD
MAVELRPYQLEAVEAPINYWAGGGQGNPLIVASVGAGKTLIQGGLVKRLLHAWPALRIGLIVHQKELIDQNFAALLRVYPGVPAGLVAASVSSKKQYRSQVVVGSIQTMYGKNAKLGPFDIIIIDECHRVNLEEKGQYRKFIAENQRLCPHARIIGLTGTAFRTKGGSLVEGDEKIFDEIVYDIGMGFLIAQGYLVPPVPCPVSTKFSLDGVRTGSNGDYMESDLQKAFDNDDLTRAAVAEIATAVFARRQQVGYASGIVFCAGVEHAQHVAGAMRAAGLRAEAVYGDMDKKRRADLLRSAKAGELDFLCGADLLTTGIDIPRLNILAWLRATKSPGLWVQMGGRGVRLSPETNKFDCWMLDFAGNLERCGPLDNPNVPKTRKKKKPTDSIELAPQKQCPECGAGVAISMLICPECQHEFPEPEHEPHDAQFTDAEFIEARRALQWRRVDTLRPNVHHKFGKPDSLRVRYMQGDTTELANEFWCFEHTGRARRTACEQWLANGGQHPIPNSTDEAMHRFHEITPPTAVQLVPDPDNPKFKRVTARRYDNHEDIAA